MAHSIGKTIAKLRKAKGWTQIELAEKLHVSDKAVSKWESEGGFPEITQLPVLAKIFDVSIDYLMTGKETEPEIITMSKIELCAKNDDPALLGSFTALSKDENDKTLIGYIKKYNSVNVLNALIDRKDKDFLAQYKHSIYCRKEDVKRRVGQNTESFYEYKLYFDISRIQEDFLLWMRANVEQKILQYLLSLSQSKLSIYDVKDIEKSGCLPVIHYLVDNFDKLPKEQKDYYFGSGKTLTFGKAWVYAYPYFIDYAYAQNQKELFDMLLEKLLKSKELYKELYKENKISRDDWWEFEHIKLLRSTVKNACKAGDRKLGEKLNAVCQPPLTSYEIYVISIDSNKKLSKIERQLAKTIHDGVVCMKELLEIKDFLLIKKTLNEYPIHYIELFHKQEKYSDKQLLKLWRFASHGDGTENSIDYAKKYLLNANYLYLVKNEKKVDLIEPEYCGSGFHNGRGGANIKEVLANLQAVRKRIIDELGMKLDKERLVGELTKEYFEKQLALNNIEMIIIKLCVRLEAILRCDYHYEGDFAEMLTKYCERNFGDDEDGYSSADLKTIKMLNNLRIKRNSIVHAEKTSVELTLDDIKCCIDHICKMG